MAALDKALRPLLEGAQFSKYQRLLELLNDWKWRGHDKRDRIVIFSERIATLEWLRKRIASDLSLPDAAIGCVHGGGSEADERSQKVLEDFGQEQAPIRILLASDMASEGLNLHFHCHRLIHFDLPWSLLRFQQRNGRIDRYGQENVPQIHYFVGESVQRKIRDMWVLEKLVEKDEAAQQGLNDPAVFLRAGDAEKEEDLVMGFVAAGGDAMALSAQMEANAAAAMDEGVDLDALLFGVFDAPDTGAVRAEESSRARIFADGFAYASAMLRRLEERGAGPARLRIDPAVRMIEFDLPETMRTTGGFGYAREGEVDDRYMPREALRGAGHIELSDDRKVVETAIFRARFDEQAWPSTQYLWDVHPVMDWLSDAARELFPRRSAPLCRVEGALARGEVAVLMHGTAPDRLGRSVADLWRVLRLAADDGFTLGDANGWRLVGEEDPEMFLSRIGFGTGGVNAGGADPKAAQGALTEAVRRFQEKVIELRAETATSLDRL